VGVDLTGQAPTPTTGIEITSTANNTLISGCRIRQFETAGISITGTPTDCLIDNVNFKTITGSNYILGADYRNGPIVKGCKSDFLRTVTAASTSVLNYGKEFFQIQGATTISNLTLLAPDTVVTIQAGTGGITFDNAGNIVLKNAASTSTITAFSATMFVCDGANWFQI
jgi:hypothetical protein